jgi:protein O-GlcNAc transferase
MMRGRHCTAILTMLGVPETIAHSVDDYITIAARLAQDQVFRAGIVARMAAQKHRLYRDRAPVEALQDLIERAVRG